MTNLPAGNNLIRNSDFDQGLDGWTLADYNDTGLTLSSGLNLTAGGNYWGVRNLIYASVSGTAATGKYFRLALSGYVPVFPSDHLAWYAEVGFYRAAGILAALYGYDAQKLNPSQLASVLGGAHWDNYTPNVAVGGENVISVGGIVNLGSSSTVRFVRIATLVQCNGGSNPYGFQGRTGVHRVNADVEDLPPISAGPAILRSYVTPEMCGAIGDGSTDDTVAWQRMVHDGRRCLVSRPRNGYGYKLTSVVLDQATEIEFEGGFNIDSERPKLFHSGSNPLFRITSSNIKVHGGLFYDGSVFVPAVGTPVVQLDVSSNSIANVTLNDFRGIRAGGLIHVLQDEAESFYFADTRVSRWWFFLLRGPGYILRKLFSSVYFTDHYVEWLRPNGLLPGETFGDINHTMMDVEGSSVAGAGGLFLDNVNLQGANRSECPNNHGMVLNGPGGGLAIGEAVIDGAGGNGVVISDWAEIRFDRLGINSCWGHGLTATNTDHVMGLLRSDGRGGGKNVGSNPDKHGITLGGDCAWWNVQCDISSQTGYAINYQGSNYAIRLDAVSAVCGASPNYNSYTNLPLTNGAYTDSNKNRITIDAFN